MSDGNPGLAAFLRALLKVLEAQGRGFAHGHEKHHSEPTIKAIDLITLFLGPPAEQHGSSSAPSATMQSLQSWMDSHREATLLDATTKQYDSAIEPALQMGCSDRKEPFTAEEKKRCRLDGGIGGR